MTATKAFSTNKEEDERSCRSWCLPLHHSLMLSSSSSEAILRRPSMILDKLSDNHHNLRCTPSTSPTAHGNKKQKRVCINEQEVQIRTTIACHEMSQQEVDAVWYSPDEFHKITESCCKQILKLHRGEILKEKKYCARGLESHTPIRSLAKRMNRNLAQQVVLDEQERQRKTGIHNDEALSRVYLAASHGSCMWANVIGLNDQKEAENVYNETL